MESPDSAPPDDGSGRFTSVVIRIAHDRLSPARRTATKLLQIGIKVGDKVTIEITKSDNNIYT